MALIAVGALNVRQHRRAAAAAAPEQRAPERRPAAVAFAEPVPFARGSEIAKFGFGSTVVLLLREADSCSTRPWSRSHVRCGTALGYVTVAT